MHEWKQECKHIEERDGKCLYYDGMCCTNKYPGGCRSIVEQCKTAEVKMVINSEKKAIEQRSPCQKIIGNICSTFINPAAEWRSSSCPLSGQIREEETTKVNPLKASKRAAKS